MRLPTAVRGGHRPEDCPNRRGEGSWAAPLQPSTLPFPASCVLEANLLKTSWSWCPCTLETAPPEGEPFPIWSTLAQAPSACVPSSASFRSPSVCAGDQTFTALNFGIAGNRKRTSTNFPSEVRQTEQCEIIKNTFGVGPRILAESLESYLLDFGSDRSVSLSLDSFRMELGHDQRVRNWPALPGCEG